MGACFLLAGYPSQASEPAPQTTVGTERIDDGKRIFAENCAPCHGAGARGDGPLAGTFDPPPQDLVAAGIHVSIKGLRMVISVPHYSTRLLRERTTEGNAPMPAWKDILSPEEIDDVVLYVRWLIENPEDSPSR